MIEDTICAPSTPPVNSSIAIIRISGPDSLRTTKSIIQSSYSLKTRFAHYETIIDKDCLIDDVILIYYQSPNSYTGEDMVEIYCHGNPIIIQKIISLLNSHGIRMAEPGEFTKRAFLNGKIDLTEAEAINHIITAKSEWEIDTSIKQMHGSLKDQINIIKNKIISFKADIEAGIDFSEEDIEFLSQKESLSHAHDLKLSIETILKRCQIGEKLSHGIDITITGKPNVGKSSILNLFLNKERAIVSNIPGTTRDIIRESVQINGMHLNLIDTAGIDRPNNEIEKIGIDLSHKKIESASIILMIIDATTGIKKPDRKILEKIKNKTSIIVINKTDISNEKAINNIIKEIPGKPVQLSAITGDGFNELKNRITNILKNEFVDIQNSFIADIRIISLLESVLNNISSTYKLISQNDPAEIIAFELQSLIDNLAEITGEITPDDILDSIFSRFCIGK